MIIKFQTSRRAGCVSAIAVHLMLGAAFGSSVAGCSDHRISLSRFLQMQEGIDSGQAKEPTEDEYSAAKGLIDRQLGPYKVGQGDVLSVTLTRLDGTEPVPQIQARVDRDGELELPGVGKIRLAGLELEDAEDSIQAAYIPHVYRDGIVYVGLLEIETTDVLVLGAVGAPGLVPLRRTERNLLHAIVGAAGVSDVASGWATLSRIRRPGEEMRLDLRGPEGLREALSLEPLESGDMIEVEAAAPNSIYVGGLVNAPRPQVYPPGVEISFLQVIAAAGGLRTDVFPRDATLIRRMPNGRDVHVKLDLDRIGTGQDPNIMLAAGDIVWVPETLATKVQDFVNRNFFIRAGFSANVTYNVSGIEFMNRQSLQSSGLGGGQNQQSAFDPFGFLTRNSLLSNLSAAPPAP